MALIVITVVDTEQGPAVSVVSEPGLERGEGVTLTPAQGCALLMLDALSSEPVKQDNGLIQLLS